MRYFEILQKDEKERSFRFCRHTFISQGFKISYQVNKITEELTVSMLKISEKNLRNGWDISSNGFKQTLNKLTEEYLLRSS